MMLEEGCCQTEGGLGLGSNAEKLALKEEDATFNQVRIENKLKWEEKVNYVQNSFFGDLVCWTAKCLSFDVEIEPSWGPAGG